MKVISFLAHSITRFLISCYPQVIVRSLATKVKKCRNGLGRGKRVGSLNSLEIESRPLSVSVSSQYSNLLVDINGLVCSSV